MVLHVPVMLIAGVICDCRVELALVGWVVLLTCDQSHNRG